MYTRTVTLDDLKGRTFEDVLLQVIKQREVLTVQLPDGESVDIQPVASLAPLPILEGTIPPGWKDAINE